MIVTAPKYTLPDYCITNMVLVLDMRKPSETDNRIRRVAKPPRLESARFTSPWCDRSQIHVLNSTMVEYDGYRTIWLKSSGLVRNIYYSPKMILNLCTTVTDLLFFRMRN